MVVGVLVASVVDDGEDDNCAGDAADVVRAMERISSSNKLQT